MFCFVSTETPGMFSQLTWTARLGKQLFIRDIWWTFCWRKFNIYSLVKRVNNIWKQKKSFFTAENTAISCWDINCCNSRIHVNLFMQMVEFKLSMNKLHAFSTTGSPCRDKHCGEINTHSNLSAYSDCLRSSTVPGADTNGQYMSQVHAVMLTSEGTKLSHQVIHSLHRAIVLCIHPPYT